MRKILCSLWLSLVATLSHAGPTADDMVMAAKMGDVSVLREGTASGFDPNYTDRQGNTLLIHAAANSNAAAVDALLKAGAKPETRNRSGDDALNYGAIKGNLDIVQALVARGLPVTRKQGWQPLTYAVLGKNMAVFNYLLKQGADPNGNNPNQASALMFAAQQGQEEMVDRLLAAGADPTWTKGSESAVDWALQNQNTDIAEKIMKAQAAQGFSRSEVLKDDGSEEETSETVESPVK